MKTKYLLILLVLLAGLPVLLVTGFVIHINVMKHLGGYCLTSISVEDAQGIAEAEFRKEEMRNPIRSREPSLLSENKLCQLGVILVEPAARYTAHCQYTPVLQPPYWPQDDVYEISSCGRLRYVGGGG